MGWSKKGKFKIEDVEDTKVLIENILENLPLEKYQICGSYRRGKKIVGDLDYLVLAYDYTLADVIKEIKKHDLVDEILTQGSIKSSIVVKGIQIDFIFITEMKKWGAALIHNTGPKYSNIKLRKKANELGYSLNEYCITNLLSKEQFYYSEEEFIYEILDLEFVPPEKRK
jgi:DNA polymerase (family 10)